MYVLEWNDVKLIITGPDSPMSLDGTKQWENNVGLSRKGYTEFQTFWFLTTTPPFFFFFLQALSHFPVYIWKVK